MLLLDEMKRDEKNKKGEGTKVEAERGLREPTVFLDGMKVVLLGWIDIMIGGGGMRRCGERERKGTSKTLVMIRETSKQSRTATT